MQEQSQPRHYAKASIAIAAVLLLPAVISLLSAVVSALTTGQVMVISLGRTETAREMVPWLQGWPRFAAPFVILGALVVWSQAKPHRWTWWLSAGLTTLGASLLAFSWWFVSSRRAGAFLLMLAFISAALYIGNRLGRVAAVLFVLLVAVVVCVQASADPLTSYGSLDSGR
jgi:drug/metabolite transporter (DMT)-like permease